MTFNTTFVITKINWFCLKGVSLDAKRRYISADIIDNLLLLLLAFNSFLLLHIPVVSVPFWCLASKTHRPRDSQPSLSPTSKQESLKINWNQKCPMKLSYKEQKNLSPHDNPKRKLLWWSEKASFSVFWVCRKICIQQMMDFVVL